MIVNVRCVECGITTLTLPKQDAIKVWNTRTVDVDRIEKALRNIKIENTSADVKICGIKIWDRLIARPTFNIDGKVYKQIAEAIEKELSK